jgi:peptidyl-prolyl cis-trans isomerase C
MEIRRRKTAFMILSTVFAGALSAMVCLAQASPASQAAGKPAAPGASAATASSPEQVVLKVGETQVTRADVDYLIGSLTPQVQQAVETRGRKPVGDEYAMMLLLSERAHSDHLDASPEIQRRLALEKLQLLAQEEYQKMSQGIQVSPEEINSYFTAHKDSFEEAQLREIVVRKKAADAKADDPGLTVEEGKTRLADIQKAIQAGSDPEAVAKKFDVPNTVMVNAKPVAVRKGEMIPELDKVAFSLQPNQFSAPVDTEQALVMFQMVSLQQPDLKTVTPQIENTLRQQKLRVALDDMKAKANIWMDPEYFKAPEAASGEPKPTPETPAKP